MVNLGFFPCDDFDFNVIKTKIDKINDEKGTTYQTKMNDDLQCIIVFADLKENNNSEHLYLIVSMAKFLGWDYCRKVLNV